MLSPDRVAVVLVSPENPLNVGFVARAMKCCAVRDLRVVGEWKEIPDPARRTGTAAPEILDGAKCVATLSEALADCAAAVGGSGFCSSVAPKSTSPPSSAINSSSRPVSCGLTGSSPTAGGSGLSSTGGSGAFV